MNENELAKSVMDFANLFLNTTDSALDIPWNWKGHNEGVRFAFFVTSLQLNELSARLSATSAKPQPVWPILAQYHAAYMDLQALVWGLSNDIAAIAPGEHDWPVRRVYSHMLAADIGFSAVVKFALEGHRAGSWTSDPIQDEDEIRIIGMSEEEYRTLLNKPLDSLTEFHQSLHNNILQEFSTITAAELDLPAVFWEPEHFPIRYRLHRFEAHLRQHTIQIEKTLFAIDHPLSEIKRLIRLLFASLAQVQGNLPGAEPDLQDLCLQTASTIRQTTLEITSKIMN